MLTSFVRTVILLFFIVFAVRLMGKRQIGQLQPAELVVTILLSEMAASPMQDEDIPLLNTVIAVLVLTGLEIIMSVISLKSERVRSLLQGNSIIIVRDGIPDQRQMKRLRFTIDDLYEALRAKDVFDISRVKYAIAETDGSLSVLLKNNDGKKAEGEDSMPFVVVKDGRPVKKICRELGIGEERLRKIIKSKGDIKDIFILTADKNGNTNLIKKDR